MELVELITKDALKHCRDITDWKQNSDFWLSSQILNKKEKKELIEFYRFWIKFIMI
jgi:phytoene/squalene synthetase